MILMFYHLVLCLTRVFSSVVIFALCVPLSMNEMIGVGSVSFLARL